MEQPSKEIALVTGVETAAERHGIADNEALAALAPAAAAALRLLADAIRRGTDHGDVVEALKQAGVHDAFADVLDAASNAVTGELEDPFEFDGRLHADNLSGAASQVRDAFRWL
ncbi:hypothetical protein [Streptomyces ipomoeae]|uniref:hypothetical protein n=1 Tax=Streptomyces ipomoeae TaxID=103232 RepID=UPI0029BF1F3F|nr:hypothetical protein [Streptomyces ipomoeae]MDX2697146.1 hypothetical protein [Streptomyces ipomoeae]MDX2843056.1 hypothetical protein [Streptomyces ipomoeae]